MSSHPRDSIGSAAKNPLISVCCTTFNMAGIIETTLDSLLSQKGDFSMELIIHDDASTDGTRQILEEYQKAHPGIFKLMLQDENQYAKEEVSLGEVYYRYIIPRANGTYIAICDGDDYWTDEYKLRKQLTFLEADETYAGCFTNATILNEIDGSGRPYLTDLEEGSISEFKIFLGGGGLYPSSTLFFRKEALTESAMYRHIMEYTSNLVWDTAFIFALATGGPIGYLNDVTAVYRRRHDGLFSSMKDNQSKLSLRTERQITGLQKISDFVRPRQRPLLKRKISNESLYVIRNGTGLSRYRLLKNLHYKEWGKWILSK